MESQEQCDRMKQLCIDNEVVIFKTFFEYKDKSIFTCDEDDFYIMRSPCNILEYKNSKHKITEQEFIKLLKNTKL